MSEELYEVRSFFLQIVAKLLGANGSWENLPVSTSPGIVALAADIEDMKDVPQFFVELNMTLGDAKEIVLRMHKFVARVYWDARAGAYHHVGAVGNLTHSQILNAYHREIDRLWTMLQEKRSITKSEFESDYVGHNPHQIPSSAAWWIDDSDGVRWLVLAGLATTGRAMPAMSADVVGPPSDSWAVDTPENDAAIEKRFRDVSFATCYKAADVLDQHGEHVKADEVRRAMMTFCGGGKRIFCGSRACLRRWVLPGQSGRSF